MQGRAQAPRTKHHLAQSIDHIEAEIFCLKGNGRCSSVVKSMCCDVKSLGSNPSSATWQLCDFKQAGLYLSGLSAHVQYLNDLWGILRAEGENPHKVCCLVPDA